MLMLVDLRSRASVSTPRVRINLFQPGVSSITPLDFPSQFLAERPVRARLQRRITCFSSVKIDSDPDALSHATVLPGNHLLTMRFVCGKRRLAEAPGKLHDCGRRHKDFVPTNSIMDTIIKAVTGRSKRGAYRQHTIDFKRMVVAQSLVAGASVSRVAREHDVNANQVFAWRKLFREGLLTFPEDQEIKLLPVTLSDPRPVSHLEPKAATATSASMIELEVGKVRLRIEGMVDATTLTVVLTHLLR
jgi:transposase